MKLIVLGGRINWWKQLPRSGSAVHVGDHKEARLHRIRMVHASIGMPEIRMGQVAPATARGAAGLKRECDGCISLDPDE